MRSLANTMYGLPHSPASSFRADTLGQSAAGVFFSVTTYNVGTAIRLGLDAANANRPTQFIVNEDGLYMFHFLVESNAGETYYIAKNTMGTPATATDKLLSVVEAQANVFISETVFVPLFAGDYIHVTSTANGTISAESYINMVKVA